VNLVMCYWIFWKYLLMFIVISCSNKLSHGFDFIKWIKTFSLINLTNKPSTMKLETRKSYILIQLVCASICCLSRSWNLDPVYLSVKVLKLRSRSCPSICTGFSVHLFVCLSVYPGVSIRLSVHLSRGFGSLVNLFCIVFSPTQTRGSLWFC
jgi:hypothetical protein